MYICLFTNKSCSKTSNKKNLVCSCFQTNWRAMLHVWPPTFKPVLQQIRLSQVACWVLTSDWIKLRGNHAIQASYVTCSKTSLPWAGRTRNMYKFSFKKYNYFLLSATNFRNRQQPELLQDSRLKAAGGKTRNIAIQLVLQQCCKTSYKIFCCLLHRTLKDKLTDSMASLDKLFGSITIDWRSLRR